VRDQLVRFEVGIVEAEADDAPWVDADRPGPDEREFVDYRTDSALTAQIDAACATAGLARRVSCEAQNMQYLTEFVRHGLGLALLPPAAIPPAGGGIHTVDITPPIRRDIFAVVPARRPPTGPTQALMDLIRVAAT